MSKTILILFVVFSFNFSNAQTDDAPNIGYIVLYNSPEANSDVYITKILNCTFSKNYGTEYKEKHKASKSFRDFVIKKYGLNSPTGAQGIWKPIRMKTPLTEQYNRALKLYKGRKVTVINNEEYKCDCK